MAYTHDFEVGIEVDPNDVNYGNRLNTTWVFIDNNVSGSLEDGTPQNPYMSVAAYLPNMVTGHQVVIKQGYYLNDGFGTVVNKSLTVYGDGRPVFEGDGITDFLKFSGNVTGKMYDLNVINWNYGCYYANTGGYYHEAQRIIQVNCKSTLLSRNGINKDLIFYNVDASRIEGQFDVVENIIFLQCPNVKIVEGLYHNVYFDFTSGANIDDSTFTGTIDYCGFADASHIPFSGGTHNIVAPNPGFALSGNYLPTMLSLSSPLLKKGFGGTNITGLPVGSDYIKGSSELDALIAANADLAYDATNQIIITGVTDESIVLSLTFSKSTSLGVIPAFGFSKYGANTMSYNTAGGYRTFRARWSEGLTPVSSATWYEFRFGEIPQVRRDSGTGDVLVSSGDTRVNWYGVDEPMESPFSMDFEIEITFKLTY